MLRVSVGLLAVLVAIAAAAPAAGAPTLQLGATGKAVHTLQDSLARVKYLDRSAVNGRFNTKTWHAVVAFQGWTHLQRDGIVGPLTRAALGRAAIPVPWSRREGIEVHIPEQVLLLVRDHRVRRAIHVSTGAGGRTPLGRFAIRRRERMSWSTTFHVWMPYAQYFWGGFAVHEYPSVPSYPASHGCVRVPGEEIRRVWDFGRVGMRLWTAAAPAASASGRHAAASAPCR